jgi:hypothetical protein
MRRRLVAAAVALLAVLAACGSGSGSSAAEIVREAPTKTAAAGSARLAMNLTLSSGALSGTVAGEGVIDLKNGLGAISLDLNSLSGSLANGKVEAVLGPDGIFVKLPGVAPATKPWIKLDLSSLAGQAGVNLGSLGQLQSADPSQALQFLKGAVGDMKKVGSEKVRDADTTHYRGTLDLQKAAASAPAASTAVSALGTSSVPTDVWIDGEGRMRKMILTVPSGAAEFEMYDFGTPVDVKEPLPSEVTDLVSLFSGGLPRR